jgi:hypothetical protein
MIAVIPSTIAPTTRDLVSQYTRKKWQVRVLLLNFGLRALGGFSEHFARCWIDDSKCACRPDLLAPDGHDCFVHVRLHFGGQIVYARFSKERTRVAE